MKIHPSRNAGFGRLGCIAIVIIAVMLWAGGQGLYTALRNRQPAVMGYADYVKTKPQAEWLSLTNCVLDLTEASYRSYGSSGSAVELFIPVQGSDEKDKKVHVLLATAAPEYKAVFSEIQGLNSDAKALAWVLKNRERAFPRRDIKGLVRFGIEMKDKERRQLAQLQANLADDFIILDDGKEPEMAKSLGLLLGGLLALVAAVWFLRGKREETTS